MANISQINVNNTTYDLKDSKAKPIFIRLSTNKKLAEATITSDWSINQFEDINGVTITHSDAYACLLRGSPLQMRLYFLASDGSGTYDSDACYLLNWYYDSTNSRYSIINNYQEPLLDDNGYPAGYWSLSLYFNAQETCVLEAMEQVSTKYPNSDLIDLSQIEYDNTNSGLTATDAQSAITELGTDKTNKSVISTNYSDVESNTSNRYIGGHIIPRRDAIDASYSDNGVTGDTVWTGMYVQDTAGRNIGKCALGATETGPLRMELYAQNYNTSGTSLGYNYLTLGVDKNSNPTVGIGGDGTKVTHASVKSAWRSALGLGTAATTDSTDYATSSHSHGSITNGGGISGNTTIASGDRLVFTDSDDSNKIKRSSITFGSSTTQCLTNKGTWADFTDTAAPSSINNGSTLPTTSISGSTSGWQSLGSKTLSAGLYLIIYTVRFPAQTSGPFYRNIAVGSATDTILNIASASQNTVSNTNSNYFSAQVSTIVAPSANTTYYFLTQVTGGGTLTIAGRYSIIKLA